MGDFLQDAFWWFVGGIAFGVGWLVRNVLMNGRRLTILETESRHRTELLKEVRADVKQLREGK